MKILWWAIALSHVDWLAAHRRTEPDERKVLVVRLDGIGDFVLWLDAAAGLRTLYPTPRYHITLLGNRLWTALARDQAIFDDVWEMDLKRFALDPCYRFRLMRRVAEGGFSIAINPTFGRDFLWGDAIIRASRAVQRLGFDGAKDRIGRVGTLLSDPWYTRLVLVDEQPQVQLELNAAFLRHLGLRSFRAAIPRVATTASVPEALAGRDYYVLCPVAGFGLRCWPLEKFARIAELIFEETGWLGVVCGGPDDREVARQLVSRAHMPLRDYTGRTTLRETLSVVAGARVVLGNETGMIHLAAAAGVPSICILGGGHYGKFFPYRALNGESSTRVETVSHHMDCFGCNWRCIYRTRRHQPAPCITSISVESVWRTTLSVLHSIRSNAAAAM